MSGNSDHEGRAAGPVPSFRLETLKKRHEFKAASGGARFSTSAFTMLRRPGSIEGEAAPLRFGFTVTKKIGNSVERNRIRRRLREAVRAASPQFPQKALDLVFLARRAAMAIDFAALVTDVARAVATLAARGDRKPAASTEAELPPGKPLKPAKKL